MKHKKRSAAYPLLPPESDYCLVGDKRKKKYDSALLAQLSAPVPELQQYICEFCQTWHNGAALLARDTATQRQKRHRKG